MAKRREEIEAEGLNLPRDQRAQLAEALITSLDEDVEVEHAWAEEVARRLADVRAGTVQLIPTEDVYADLDRLRS